MVIRELGNEKSENLRRIGEEFVIQFQRARNHRHCLIRRHIELGMFGAQMRRHSMGALGLVVTLFVETDGEGLHQLARLRLLQSNHGRGIDHRGKKSAQSTSATIWPLIDRLRLASNFSSAIASSRSSRSGLAAASHTRQ